jgi:dolichyl-phosphate beta-glucosyltransferase
MVVLSADKVSSGAALPASSRATAVRRQCRDYLEGKFAPTDHELTVIIPAYNEQARLPTTLATLGHFLEASRLDYRVLVADDCSCDNTARLTDGRGPRFSTLRLASHGGKGRAVRAAMLAATGQIVAFTDADLPYELSALVEGYGWIGRGECDVAVGARSDQAPTVVHRRLARKLASAAFRQIVSRLVSPDLPDTQCGLKIFSRRSAIEIFSRSEIDGFAFDAEAILLALRLGLVLRRLNVTLINEHTSTVSLMRDALPMLRDVIRTRIRLGRHPIMPRMRADWGRLPEQSRTAA